jgi:hypothetical protein
MTPSVSKWQDQVRNPSLLTGNLREVDDSKGCCGPLPGKVKKEHPAQLETRDSDARALGVLGSLAFE